jgi:outer membrane protein assembly factor BamB
MSLIDRRLRRGVGNLPGPLASVNAASATLLVVLLATFGCAANVVVPREAESEVREYLGSSTRGPAVLERVDSAPATVWRTNAGRGSTGAPAVGDRVMAVATVDRWVYALDTRTGRVYWRYRGDAPYGSGPVMTQGRVIAASEGRDGKLTAITVATGKRRWQANVGDVGSPIAAGDSTVYGATQQGVAFAYRIDNGRQVWRRVVGPTRSGPLMLGRHAVYATLTDTLVILDAGTGANVARTRLPVSTVAPLARLDDSTALLTSPSGRVVAAAVPSGRVRWEVDTREPVYGSPVVTQDTVYALTNRCTLWTIPVAAPSRAVTASIGCVSEAAPAVVRGGVLVATVRGEVIYYDRSARRTVWTRTLRGELRQPPTVRNGQILVAPILGPVVSFR